MVILDKGYTEIRNKYIRPLSEYYLPYRSLNNNNIKEMLLNKIQNVTKDSGTNYFLNIPEDDLFKALLGDIFLFYIRSILQRNDFLEIEDNKNMSANWNIVTHYYGAFYNASLLLRLCYRGNLFLDKEYKRDLENIISHHIGERIQLESNMFYSIEEKDGVYVLKLIKSENNTHEVVWKKIHDLLQEISLLSNNKSQEKAFLISCLNINHELNQTFPSQLRNMVNYQALYGKKYVDKQLYPIIKNTNWAKEIISFDANEVCVNDNRKINVYVAYTKYIENLCFRLMQDYFEMLGKDDHILAAINKWRESKLTIPNVLYTDQ